MRRAIRALLTTAIVAATSAGCQPALDRPTGALRAWDLPADVTARCEESLQQAAPPPEPATPPLPVAPNPPVSFTTVQSPELPRRLISLVECVALALENGRTGEFFDAAGSSNKTSVRGLSAQVNVANASDSIRVFAYEPAAVATGVTQALARFDPYSETNFFWNRVDQPSRFLRPETPFEQLVTRDKVDAVSFDTGLYQPLATGGLAGLRLRTAYENDYLLPNSGILNPAYRPALEFSFEQPLLQGAGVFINQLLDTRPDGLRKTLPDGARAPGIVVARITERQSQLEFERQLQALLFRVEEAYWQLYCAYWDLYAADNGLKQAHQAWLLAKNRKEAGGIGDEDLAMLEEQYQFFRGQRLQALGNGQPGRPGVLEAERQLRYVVGLPPEDGTRLTPADPLDFVLYEPDPTASVADAQAHRPELRQVEEEIRAAEAAIDKAGDRLKPDLRLVSRYDINGLGGDLGSGIQSLAETPHHEWELGMRLQFPLGFRAGNAEMTRAKLLLAQRLAFFQDQKQKLLFSLQRSFRDLVQYREQYQIRKSERLAAARQLEVRYQQYRAGGPDPKKNQGSFIDLLLRAQRNWADALREEHVALCNYRVAIADYERQKGTICEYANVTIQEGTTPTCVVTGASKYLRRRNEPILEQAMTQREQSLAITVPDAAPAKEATTPAHLGSPVPVASPGPTLSAAPSALLGMPEPGSRR